MNRYTKQLKQISRSKAILPCLLVLVAGTLLAAQQSAPDGVRFEIVSVRVLTNKEAADRSPDFVGPNIAVRLRLSSSAHGLSFYGWKNSVVPAGYKVERTEHGVSWLYGKGGTEKRTASPGLQAVLFGSTGEWITLPAHSAIEWEELDSTLFAGEKHAFTAFIRQRDSGEAAEVMSDEFAVPSSATPTTR